MHAMVDRLHSQRLLACVGEPSRFRVVRALLAREQCVTQLARSIGLSQSCTTRHLQALRREGVVRGVRQGKRVVFRLCAEDPRIGALIEWASGVAPTAPEREARAGANEGGRSSPRRRATRRRGSGGSRRRSEASKEAASEADEAVEGQADPEPVAEERRVPGRHPASTEIEDFLL